MIDFTDFQTAWNEYNSCHSLMDYVLSAIEMGIIFSVIVGFAAFVVYELSCRPSLGSACKKIVLPSAATGLIVSVIAFGIMVYSAPSKTGNMTKPDSFGTVISEQYGLYSLSCKTSSSTFFSKMLDTDDLYMGGDSPPDGEYACTGYDSKHIYKNLTLVVNDNKAGLYDKRGNALALKEADDAD